MGENHLAAVPSAVYGFVLLMAGVAYLTLSRSIIAEQGHGSALKAAVGRDYKGQLSAALYAAAIPLAFLNHRISAAIYVGVAAMWLVPDPRIERQVRQSDQRGAS